VYGELISALDGPLQSLLCFDAPLQQLAEALEGAQPHGVLDALEARAAPGGGGGEAAAT
jgi:hypothetical protein